MVPGATALCGHEGEASCSLELWPRWLLQACSEVHEPCFVLLWARDGGENRCFSTCWAHREQFLHPALQRTLEQPGAWRTSALPLCDGPELLSNTQQKCLWGGGVGYFFLLFLSPFFFLLFFPSFFTRSEVLLQHAMPPVNPGETGSTSTTGHRGHCQCRLLCLAARIMPGTRTGSKYPCLFVWGSVGSPSPWHGTSHWFDNPDVTFFISFFLSLPFKMAW